VAGAGGVLVGGNPLSCAVGQPGEGGDLLLVATGALHDPHACAGEGGGEGVQVGLLGAFVAQPLGGVGELGGFLDGDDGEGLDETVVVFGQVDNARSASPAAYDAPERCGSWGGGLAMFLTPPVTPDAIQTRTHRCERGYVTLRVTPRALSPRRADTGALHSDR